MRVAFTASAATAVADGESGTPSSGHSIIACPALYALGIRLVGESPTSAAILPTVSMRAAAPLPAPGRAWGSTTGPVTPRHGIGPARNVTTHSESAASRCAAAHLAVLASIAEDHRIPPAFSGLATANPITSPQLSGSQLVGAVTQLPPPQTAAVTATEKFTGGVAEQGNGNPPTSVFSPRSGASSTPNSSGTGQFPFGTGAIMITVPADRPGTDNTYPFSTN
ncbi:hypothetical protein [Nocardia arthritidis]|uniref:Uncharacterized protein n=1 Tax=Nocardia arthritidis TaxID=228602 RepID=A0A6G9YJM2_9NOCA|nr:hypothetical protein [Nocardia arthritidis]QIS13505.1 hypothetical protein F5544_28260 [Nocardia arthritidis]